MSSQVGRLPLESVRPSPGQSRKSGFAFSAVQRWEPGGFLSGRALTIVASQSIFAAVIWVGFFFFSAKG